MYCMDRYVGTVLYALYVLVIGMGVGVCVLVWVWVWVWVCSGYRYGYGLVCVYFGMGIRLCKSMGMFFGLGNMLVGCF